MRRVENLSILDHSPELVRAIARPSRHGDPQGVIDSLTSQGADPCDLRRKTLAFVAETGGPSSKWIGLVVDAFAEHDADRISFAARAARKQNN